MSTRYLRCAIREQIDRAESLRAAIPDIQRHAALERLAAATGSMYRAPAGGGGGMRHWNAWPPRL